MAKETENGATPAEMDGSATCGVVMPIADFSPYPNGHWADVLAIVSEAVEQAGFSAKLVSSEDAVGIIQQRIVQNLYDNEIVVVDVSGRNPNVMFELGMRLAFDKPTVIIKDELTPYTFDTSTIEHLGYRSDLHYQSVLQFKEQLALKVRSTYAAGREAGYSTFLKHFGRIEPAVLAKQDGSELSLILDELSSLRREVRSVTGTLSLPTLPSDGSLTRTLKFRISSRLSEKEFSSKIFGAIAGISRMNYTRDASDGTYAVEMLLSHSRSAQLVHSELAKIFHSVVMLPQEF